MAIRSTRSESFNSPTDLQIMDLGRQFDLLIRKLDEKILWILDDKSKFGAIDTGLLQKMGQRCNKYNQKINALKTEVDQLIFEPNDLLAVKKNYCIQKINRVFVKLNVNPSSTAPSLNIPSPQMPQQVVSYKVSRAAPTHQSSILNPLQQIASLLRSGKEDEALKLFATLSDQKKGHVQEALWRTRGKPNYAGDFGRDSMFGIDKKSSCYSNPLQKAAAVEICLTAEMNDTTRNKLELAQKTVAYMKNAWQGLDSSTHRGQEKNDRKRDSLIDFAKAIVPLFSNATVAVPQISNRSYQAMAEAYVKAYPCLLSFMLQLIPDLRISGEAQSSDSPKSSSLVDPKLADRGDHGRKQYRTNIINETLETLSQGYYINSKGEKVELMLQSAINSLECHSAFTPRAQTNTFKTKLFLDKADCLTVTHNCAERNLTPIVLDAASDDHFGGGYLTGAGAQEENMCRRSGLSHAADPSMQFQSQNFYPISQQGSGAALYVNNIPVFRGEEVHGYPYLDKPFECAVAITAAYNFNGKHGSTLQLVTNGDELRIPANEAKETKERLRTVLKMAELHGHKSVVLMPIGAGAFCNPPKHICEMMMELITQEFSTSFEEVHISIIDDHNTGKSHNKEGNYAAFEKTIDNNFKNAMRQAGIEFRKQ